MIWLKRILLGGGCSYLLALGFVYFTQRSFQYFPPNQAMPANLAEQFGANIISTNIENVGEIKHIYRAAQNGAPTLIFLHGNGSAAWQYLEALDFITEAKAGFLAVEYPGYDGSPGRPNESDILATALAGYDALRAKGVLPENIIIHGDSLGASAGIYLAAQREAAGLVLSAPFLSMRAMARKQMPFFPTSIMLKDTYRSDKWIQNVKAPVLILHGDADTLIPPVQSKALYDLYPGPKDYQIIRGGTHSLWNTDMPNKVKGFINKVSRK